MMLNSVLESSKRTKKVPFNKVIEDLHFFLHYTINWLITIELMCTYAFSRIRFFLLLLLLLTGAQPFITSIFSQFLWEKSSKTTQKNKDKLQLNWGIFQDFSDFINFFKCSRFSFAEISLKIKLWQRPCAM